MSLEKTPLSIFAAVWILGAPLGAEARQTPCSGADLPADVQALADRLGAGGRAGQAALAEAAETALRPSARAGDDQAIARCLLYLAADARFYLSAKGEDAPTQAARALEHLITVEARGLPDRWTAEQVAKRIEAAWARMGAGHEGLNTDARPVEVTLPPLDPQAQVEITGGPLTLKLSMQTMAPARRLRLGPGRYTVKVITHCGALSSEILVARGQKPRWPGQPACSIPLKVVDRATGRTLPTSDLRITGSGGLPLTPAALTGGAGTVTFSAPGYTSETRPIPPDGRPVEVELNRCQVIVKVKPTPSHAAVTGEGPTPWGPHLVTGRAAGHKPVSETIEIPPPPAGCGDADAAHVVELKLPRPIKVLGRTHSGDALPPTRLIIDEAEVDMADLALPPGTYVWQADHPSRKSATGRLEVRPCEASKCPPVRLHARFPSTGRMRAGPRATLWIGGTLAGLGLIMGAVALSAQNRIDSYTTRVDEPEPIDDLVDTRDASIAASNGFFAAGGLTLLTGYLWHKLGGDE